MDKKEFFIFVSGLRTYYPSEKILPNEQAMQLWYEQLKDIDYKVAETALHKWVALNKWSPTIADIREMAADIMFGELPDWGEAWGKVLKAVSNYGSYYPDDAYEFLGEPIATCVKRIGWLEICFSENLDTIRANFRMIYEAEAKKQRREAQIPARLTANPLKRIDEVIG